MLTRHSYSSGHLILSHFGICKRSFVEAIETQSYITPPIHDSLPDFTSYQIDSFPGFDTTISCPYTWFEFLLNLTWLNIGFHESFAMDVACQQGTLTPPDTWSRPIWDLHMFYLLRPILFPTLYFSRTIHFKHPSVPSQFCSQH